MSQVIQLQYSLSVWHSLLNSPSNKCIVFTLVSNMLYANLWFFYYHFLSVVQLKHYDVIIFGVGCNTNLMVQPFVFCRLMLEQLMQRKSISHELGTKSSIASEHLVTSGAKVYSSYPMSTQKAPKTTNNFAQIRKVRFTSVVAQHQLVENETF